MRAILDTNVLVSGLLWHDAPHALIEQICSGNLTLVSSPVLMAELVETLGRAKFQRAMTAAGISPEQVFAGLRVLAEVFDPPPLSARVSRDPDDDAVLALAAATHVDWIISGDGDLLVLGAYAGIPIVTPSQALVMLTQ